MKKLLFVTGVVIFLSCTTGRECQAQMAIIDVIKAGVKKVIKAVDLKIQRLQNKTVWLQNAQKVLENKMSQLKLTEISDWANKQKDLYANYFDELWKVKNVISNYQLVKGIIGKQIQIVIEYHKAFSLSKQDKNFTTKELDYMQSVYTGILDESLKNIEQVELVIRAFATQMSDAKRLEIIHTAGNQIDQNIADLRQFNQQNIIVSLQRSKEKNNIDVVKALYGIAQ